MIDRVELALLDHVAEVGDLDPGNAIILQQDREAFNEIVDPVDMGGNVVGNHDVGPPAFPGELACKVGPEESLQRRHAAFAGASDRAGGGIDAEDGNAGVHEIPQQVAIIARHLDHQTRGTEGPLLEDVLDVLATVLEQGGRERGEVRIVTAEQHVGRDRLSHLHQGAVMAKSQLQRKVRLRLRELALVQQGVGQRLAAEIKE
jgi:hypothetical protein